MAKIINLPTLCKLTEHQKNELVIQVLELREKMNSIVDLISDQQETKDLRQHLHNELMAVESMLTNAGELLRSAYTREKMIRGWMGNAGSADLERIESEGVCLHAL